MHKLAGERQSARAHTHKGFQWSTVVFCRSCKTLARDKWTSLRQNKMEEYHKGHMFHIGTKGENE